METSKVIAPTVLRSFPIACRELSASILILLTDYCWTFSLSKSLMFFLPGGRSSHLPLSDHFQLSSSKIVWTNGGAEASIPKIMTKSFISCINVH